MVVQNFRVVPAYDVVKIQSYEPTITLAHEDLPCPFAAPTYGYWGNIRKTGDDFSDWHVNWTDTSALLGSDAKALTIKFDVSNTTALPVVPVLYESIGTGTTDVVTNYYMNQQEVRAFLFVGAGGNCVPTRDTVNFVAGLAGRDDLMFMRASRIAKVWCEYDDPHLTNLTGSGTMSAVHTKILLKLLQAQYEASGSPGPFRDYIHTFFANNVPYSPAVEQVLSYRSGM